ncbi:type VI secretion system baseplate subunit TssG [Aquincola sp. MAHUQ-54]|uniref:Type VI secretion system baseplate subunit TssG n=1 Tax=Aquincola agrisoli TaxID=3119538 RepID=A0AAW9QAZ4_9BURK
MSSPAAVPFWRYNFFQLMRLIEGRLQPPGQAGLAGRLSLAPLRVLPEPALRFPAAEVSAYDPAGASPSQPARMRVTFGGLYGVQSPLPGYFLDDIARGAPGADALAGFLDIFNHRLNLLHYEAWKKYRYPQRFEPGGRDRLSRSLLGLAGLALDGAQAGTPLPPAHLLAYLGPFSQRSRSAEGLRGVVAQRLGGTAVHIEQWVPRWIELAQPLPLRRAGGAAGAPCIGDDAVLGRRMPDRAGKVRIVVGPLAADGVAACLPGGRDFDDVVALARLYLGRTVDFDLCVLLSTAGLPPAALRRGGPRLGWTSALRGPLPGRLRITVHDCGSRAGPRAPLDPVAPLSLPAPLLSGASGGPPPG